MDAMEMLTAARAGDDPFTDEEAPETKMEMGDATTYQGALIAALDDEVITEDEWAMLDLFRSCLACSKKITPPSRRPSAAWPRWTKTASVAWSACSSTSWPTRSSEQRRHPQASGR